MTSFVNVYFELPAESHRLLEYLEEENLEYSQITPTTYLLENIKEEQYTDIRLRFSISTTHVVKPYD